MAAGSQTPAQKSILGFFQRKGQASQPAKTGTPQTNGTKTLPIGSPKKQLVKKAAAKASQTLTPAPSSDAAVNEDEDEEDVVKPSKGKRAPMGLPSPVTPMGLDGVQDDAFGGSFTSSPSRKVEREKPLGEWLADVNFRAGEEEGQLRRVCCGR